MADWRAETQSQPLKITCFSQHPTWTHEQLPADKPWTYGIPAGFSSPSEPPWTALPSLLLCEWPQQLLSSKNTCRNMWVGCFICQDLWVHFPAKGLFYRLQLSSNTTKHLLKKMGTAILWGLSCTVHLSVELEKPLWNQVKLTWSILLPVACCLFGLSDPTSQFPHQQD